MITRRVSKLRRKLRQILIECVKRNLHQQRKIWTVGLKILKASKNLKLKND